MQNLLFDKKVNKFFKKEDFDFKIEANEIKKERGFLSLLKSSLSDKKEKELQEKCYSLFEFHLYIHKALDKLEKKQKESEILDLEQAYYFAVFSILLEISTHNPYPQKENKEEIKKRKRKEEERIKKRKKKLKKRDK